MEINVISTHFLQLFFIDLKKFYDFRPAKSKSNQNQITLWIYDEKFHLSKFRNWTESMLRRSFYFLNICRTSNFVQIFYRKNIENYENSKNAKKIMPEFFPWIHELIISLFAIWLLSGYFSAWLIIKIIWTFQQITSIKNLMTKMIYEPSPKRRCLGYRQIAHFYGNFTPDGIGGGSLIFWSSIQYDRTKRGLMGLGECGTNVNTSNAILMINLVKAH